MEKLTKIFFLSAFRKPGRNECFSVSNGFFQVNYKTKKKKPPIKRKRNVEFECDQAKQKYLDTI